MFSATIFVVLAVLLALFAHQAQAYDASFSLAKGQRYVAFCGVAYCTDPIVGKDTVDTWKCNACKQFPHVNATTFHGTKQDANGFVAYDADANEIIVSFSGTDPLSIRNWIDDLDFVQVDYPLCSGCKVHKGFYETYNSVKDTVATLVKNNMNAHPTARITVTGHSLGAAMAAHCMADLITKFGASMFNTGYTYGMPRVGNTNFEKWYISVIPGTFRVTHQKDPVPHLPPENWNFHHMPYEVFYTSDYNKWKLCSIDGEDPNCADQYLASLDVLMHLNYLDFDFTTNYLSCEL